MRPPRPTEMCHLQIIFSFPGADHRRPTQGAVGKQGPEAPSISPPLLSALLLPPPAPLMLKRGL